MILGTHNSCTGYPLVWYQKPFKFILDIVAKCQNLTIPEQYNYGVRLFNIQVSDYKDTWIPSHGLAWYNIRLIEILDYLEKQKDKSYIQLVYDNHFLHKKNIDSFKGLYEYIKSHYTNIELISVVIEKPREIIYTRFFDCLEKYWTYGCYKTKNIFNYFPYPWYWAKRNNSGYKEEYKNRNSLMLDFVELCIGL